MSTFARACGVLAFVVAMLSTLSAASAERLEPRDTTASAPGYGEFRQKLLRAVARRDSRFVESIVDRDVRFSFGIANGRSAFLKNFRLRNPRSEFWGEMERILRMAGAYDAPTRTVWQPYFFHKWPGTLDAFTHAVATGRGIPVRRSPSASSPIVATLDYDVVAISGRGSWMKVKTPAGVVGYVQEASLYCPVWRRAAFQQVRGAWRLTVFVQGD